MFTQVIYLARLVTMMTMRLAGEVKVYKDEGNDTEDKMEGNLGRV